MSKRIKPNAEHRIVDGDIISSDIDEKIKRGKEFSEQKAAQETTQLLDETDLLDEATTINDPDSILNDVDPNETIAEAAKKPRFFKRHISGILWLSLFIVVIAVLFLTRPDTDWQVQKINELQNQVASLKQQNQSFQTQVQEQFQEQMASNRELIAEQVKEVLANTENQPAVTQEEIDQLKQTLAEQIDGLHQQLQALSGAAGEDLNQALAELSAKAATLTPQATEKLNELEASLQQKMNEFSSQLSDLFAFKEEQTVLSKQPSVLKVDAPLSSLQIQQWIIEINTQWVLNGRIAETRQQLFALEQAASLSDFVYTTQLARLIGQDLGYLQQVQKQASDNALPQTTELKQAIARLTVSEVESPSPEAPQNSTAEAGAFDQLLMHFNRLITLKKRESDTDVAEVNAILLNDVMKQRLALLVDRLEWGMSTQSKELVLQAVDDIKQFISQHYTNQFSVFNGLLEPFVNIEFVAKQPLAITRLDQSLEE